MMGFGCGHCQYLTGDRDGAMKKLLIKISAFAVAASLLTACQNETGMGDKQTGGTLVGAAAGGLVGSQFGGGSGKLVATGVGVLLGGLLGNAIGKSMDDEDKRRA